MFVLNDLESVHLNFSIHSMSAACLHLLIQWNLIITNLSTTKVFGITNYFLYPSNSKMYGKEL